MDMSSLFPTDGIGGVLSTQPGPHVKFPAGIMTRDSESNRVTADPRKGTFQIITLADGLMHMQWQPRNSETAEEDLILFGTAETEMKLCNSCPDSARVYVLRWREGDQRMFFWMQGKDPSQDAANIALVNNLLEHGPDAQQARAISPRQLVTPNVSTDTPPRDEDVVMEPAVDSPAQESTTQPTASPRNQITLDQLREALQTRNVDVSTAQRELVLTTPSALDLLNTEALEPVLPHSRLTELLPSLMEHLPEQDRSVDRLIQVLRSPPVRVQAAALSNALQSGQASEILRSFGLPVGDGQSPYGMKAFLDALIEYQKQQNGEQ